MRPALPGTLCRAVLLVVGLLGPSGHAPGQSSAAAPAAQAPKPFVMEFYYKVKWGHLEEFLELYKRNHYPILRRLQQQGEILEMSAAFPLTHAAEDKRWDLRFTIVYKDAVAAHVSHGDDPWIKDMYPDQQKFKQEELRRFELLLEHMDVPVRVDRLEKW